MRGAVLIGNVDLNREILLVAEIGNNHEGNPDVAARLVEEAARCGAGAVKFQTFRSHLFVRPTDVERFERLSSFELTGDDFARLGELARSLGLAFISTPLDLESVATLEPLVDAYKIASGDNTFYPLIDAVCRTGKPLIVSAGLADLALVRKAKEFVEERWRVYDVGQDMAVLHCVSSYPVPPAEASLAAIPVLARELGCTVGYSDHTIGTDACLYAIAAGARIVEKHFTLDKRYSDFRDHHLSADPGDLAELARGVRRVAELMGHADKRVQPSEEASIRLARRSIVAAGSFPAGHVLRWDDITWMRPADGLPPGDESLVVGRALRRDVAFGEPILQGDLE